MQWDSTNILVLDPCNAVAVSDTSLMDVDDLKAGKQPVVLPMPHNHFYLIIHFYLIQRVVYIYTLPSFSGSVYVLYTL
jgi:hypothetical protein